MKLSPPASSSDLEAAREIARRLYQRRRREDRPEMEDDYAPAPVPIVAPAARTGPCRAAAARARPHRATAATRAS